MYKYLALMLPRGSGADFKKNREMSKTNVAQAHFNR